ncbi:putative PPE family immunogenic protein PPE68 [Mycobacterium marinum]|uniref:PPE family protein n=1 Tax=Mycobacterium marinum TaxID=1781 RepID=UPI000E3D3EA2|nr:PPE family protein [Mycobacterium marinum]RFZ63033.1 putative PPE family immunogenic protein PPE68 [Mycobacterium marinum]
MFGPPEVITGRLMSGAGAAPMTAASTEFTAAATAYEISIDRLTALLGYLSSSWQGEAAMAMQRVLVRFITVNRILQAQVIAAAARTASQAAAFTEAYTTMAQMVEIVENRVTTEVLHATNFLGMNTIPIGVKEGQYLEMWMHDVAVQTNYLAQTVANTTFDPFTKLPPLTGVTSFPSVIIQALNAAMSATDRVEMQAIKAHNTAAMLKAKVGGLASAASWMAQRAQDGAQKAEAQAAVARFRENNAQRETADRPAEQMGRQLAQQAPQQIASVGQSAMQAPQQAAQQVQQVSQQFGSQIANLMNQVSPSHRLDNSGFFDTQPTSATLDRLAGSPSGAGLTAAIRVPTLAGLSGSSTGFRFPSGWDGPLPGSAPAAPTGPQAVRPGGSTMPLQRAHRRDEDKAAIVKHPDTELIPIWGHLPEEEQTVSAGALIAAERTIEQEAG